MKTTLSILGAILAVAFTTFGQGTVQRVPTIQRLLQSNPYATGTAGTAVFEVEAPATNSTWGSARYAVWTATTNLTSNGTNVFASPFGGQWVMLDRDDPIQDARWYGGANQFSIDSQGNLVLGTTNVIAKLSALDSAVLNRAFLTHFHDAADVNSGRFPAVRLGTGVADTNSFLRGDGQWATLTTNGSVIGAGSTMTVNGTTVTNLTNGASVGWSSAGQQASPYILSGAHITNALLPGATLGNASDGTVLTTTSLGQDNGPSGMLYEMMGRSSVSGRVIAIAAPKARSVLDASWSGHTHTSFTNLTIIDQLYVQSLNVLTKFSQIDVDLNHRQAGSLILTNVVADTQTNYFWAGDHSYKAVTTNAIPGLVQDIANLNIHQVSVNAVLVTNLVDAPGAPAIGWTVSGKKAWPIIKPSITIETPKLLNPKLESPLGLGEFHTNSLLYGPSLTFIPFYNSITPNSGPPQILAVDLGTVITNMGLAYATNFLALTGGTVTGTINTTYLNAGNAIVSGDFQVNGESDLGSLRFGLDGTSISSWSQVQGGSDVLTNIQATAATNAFWAGDHVYRLITTNMIPGLDEMFSRDIDGTNVVSGYVSPARLGSGIPGTNTFLRGDGQWAVLTTNGTVAAAGTNTIWVKGNFVTNLIDGPNVSWAISGQQALPYIPAGVSVTNLNSVGTLTAYNITASSTGSGGGALISDSLQTRAAPRDLNLTSTPYIAFFDNSGLTGRRAMFSALMTDLFTNIPPFRVVGSAVTNIYDPLAATNNIGWTVSGRQALAFVKPGSRLTANELLHPSVQSTIDRTGFNTIITTVGPGNTFIPFYQSASPDTSAVPLEAVDLGTVVSGLGLAYDSTVLHLSGGSMTGDIISSAAIYAVDITSSSTLTTPEITTDILTFTDATSITSINQVQGGNIILTNIEADSDPAFFWAGNHVYKAVTTNMIPGLVGDVANLHTLINQRQLGSPVLTNVANLNGGTPTNFFAGDGVFKTLTTNMVPGLVQDILNAAAHVGPSGYSTVVINDEQRDYWNIYDTSTIVWDKSSPHLLAKLQNTSVLPAHLHPSTIAYFALAGHNHLGGNQEIWLSDSTATHGNGAVVAGWGASGTTFGNVSIGEGAASSGNAGISIGWGASATQNATTAAGVNANAMHSHSSAFGADAATTTLNQVRLGTSSDTVSVPGKLAVVGDSTIGPTNIITSLANKAELIHYHDGSDIHTGIVPAARLGSNGSGGATKFLREDNQWQFAPGGPFFVASGTSVGLNTTGSLISGVRAGETLTFAANTLANKLIHVQAMGTWSTATSNWSDNEIKIVIGGFTYKYTTSETGSEEFTNENWKFDVFIPASAVGSTWGTFDRRTDRPLGSVLIGSGYKIWMSESAVGTGTITLTSPNAFDLYFTNGSQSMNNVTCTRVVVTIL